MWKLRSNHDNTAYQLCEYLKLSEALGDADDKYLALHCLFVGMLVLVRIKELAHIKMPSTVLAWHTVASSQMLIPSFISCSLQFTVILNISADK